MEETSSNINTYIHIYIYILEEVSRWWERVKMVGESDREKKLHVT